MPNGESFHETVVEEDAEGSGEVVRKEASIPSDSAVRKKFFLAESHRDAFTFEAVMCVNCVSQAGTASLLNQAGMTTNSKGLSSV
jgi:hypothetical protein